MLQWLKQDEQVRRIKMVQRRLNDDLAQISIKIDTSPQRLFSSLRQRIIKLPMNKASAAQWCATVLNTKKSGIREEEIRWSVLWQYLSQPESQTLLFKDDLLSAIGFIDTRLELSTQLIRNQAGGLNFDEVAQRLPHQDFYKNILGLDDSCHCIFRYLDQKRNYRVGVLKTLRQDHSMALNTAWFVLDPHGRPVTNLTEPESFFYSHSNTAMQAAHRHARHLGCPEWYALSRPLRLFNLVWRQRLP